LVVYRELEFPILGEKVSGIPIPETDVFNSSETHPIVLAGSGFWAYRQFVTPEPQPPTLQADVNTTAVNSGVGLVSAEGQIVPLRDVSLAFDMPGIVAEAAAGDTVAAGDPLLRLDDADQQIALIQAQAELTQVQANLQAAQAGEAQAQTAVSAAQVGVSAAEVNLALLTAAATDKQVAVSQAGVDVAAAGLSQAAGSRDAQLTISDAQIRDAEAQVAATASLR